ncbi:hypothetical protein KBK24_0121460 [Burkholderia sp. K24]|nr:hypothetical protein KBK24_0121460 [Burkholderia sp. K24]
MSDSMFLSNDELVELTGRRHRSCQAEVLRSLAVDHKIRPDGRVIVLRRHVEQQFGITAERGRVATTEPDWSAA